jgi:DNA-binding transcriptional LysR family regulator
LGLTLLPKAIVAPARDHQLAVHDLAPSEAWVDTVFIRRRDAYVSTALSAFLELARNRSPAQAT